MDAREAMDTLGLSEVPGSVGELMARPVPVSLHRRAAVSSLALGLFALALAFLVRVLDDRIEYALSVLEVSGIDLSAVVPVLTISGAMLTICGVAALVVGLVRRKPKYDIRAATRRAIYSRLLMLPRFGVTRRTLLSDVALRDRPVLGVPGAVAFRVRGAFDVGDFSGVRPGELAAYDYELVGGELYVFYTPESKKRFAEKIRGKKK